MRQGTCTTCGGRADLPYRRRIDGEITEGCIDAFHDGALEGDSLAWHEREVSRELRADHLAAGGATTAREARYHRGQHRSQGNIARCCADVAAARAERDLESRVS